MYLPSPTNPLYYSVLSPITSVVYSGVYLLSLLLCCGISPPPYSPTLLWLAPPEQYSTLLLTGELLNTKGFMTKIANPQPSIQLITGLLITICHT